MAAAESQQHAHSKSKYSNIGHQCSSSSTAWPSHEEDQPQLSKEAEQRKKEEGRTYR
jgi:hypothetical protein